MSMISVNGADLQEAAPNPVNISADLARSAGSEAQAAFQDPEHRGSSVADPHDGNLVSDEHLPDTEKRVRLASQDSIRANRADTLEGSPVEQLNGLNFPGSSTIAKGTPSTGANQSPAKQHTIPVRNAVPSPVDPHAVAIGGPSATGAAQSPPVNPHAIAMYDPSATGAAQPPSEPYAVEMSHPSDTGEDLSLTVDPHAVAMGDPSATDAAQRPANQHTEVATFTTAAPDDPNRDSAAHTNGAQHTLVITNSDITMLLGSFGTMLMVKIGTDYDSNACIEYLRSGTSEGSEASRRRLSSGTHVDIEETTSASQRRLSNGTQVTNGNREVSTDSNHSNLSRHNGDVASVVFASADSLVEGSDLGVHLHL